MDAAVRANRLRLLFDVVRAVARERPSKSGGHHVGANVTTADSA
jgi:hypothetical protein